MSLTYAQIEMLTEKGSSFREKMGAKEFTNALINFMELVDASDSLPSDHRKITSNLFQDDNYVLTFFSMFIAGYMAHYYSNDQNRH